MSTENKSKKKSSVLKRIVKGLAWVVASIIFLFVLLALLLQINSVQNFAKDKALAFLQKKLKTTVRIDHLDIEFPKKVVLEGIYIEDLSKDTLLSAGTLKVDIAMLGILQNKIVIDEIDFENATAKLYRDSSFNFQFIIDAFTDTTAVEDTTSAPMELDINEVRLKNVRFVMNDLQSGNDMAFHVGKLNVDIDVFDINEMNFEVPLIELEKIAARIVQSKPLIDLTVPTDTLTKDAPGFNIKLGKLLINKLDLSYKNFITEIYQDLKIGTLDARPEKIDLPNQVLIVRSLLLDKTYSKTTLANKPARSAGGNAEESMKKVGEEIKAEAKQGWTIQCASLDINDNHFIFNNYNQAPTNAGMDYARLDVDEFNMTLKDFGFQTDSIYGYIIDNSFVEKNSAFTMKKMKADFLYSDKTIVLENFLIQTPKTILRDKLILEYESIDQLTEDIGSAFVNVHMKNSQVGVADVLTFAPQLWTNDFFRNNKNEILYFNSQINGRIKNLAIREFELWGLPGTSASLNGEIKGLPNADNLFVNLNIKKIASTRAAVEGMMPAGSMPESIELPQQFALSGKAVGSMKEITAKLNMNSSYGRVDLLATLKDITDENRATYNVEYTINKFDAGKLIKQSETLGTVTANGKINGRGLSPEKMNTSVSTKVYQVFAKDYNYQNITFNGKLANGRFTGKGGVDDPNVDITFEAAATLGETITNLSLTSNIDSVRLQQLNLASEPLNFRGKVNADVASLDLNSLNGTAYIYDAVVLNGKEQFMLDSISVKAKSNGAENEITLRTPFAMATLNGNYKLAELGDYAIQHINQYYYIAPVNNAVTPNQNIFFNATISPHPAIEAFVPGLTLNAPIVLQGQLTDSAGIVLNATLPQLKMNSLSVAGGNLKVDATNDSLRYNLSANQIQAGESYSIPQILLNGGISNNIAVLNLNIKDNEQRNKYKFQSLVQKDKDDLKFNLTLEEIILNYEKWTTNPDNYLAFGPSGLYANNFALRNANQSLTVQSRGSSKNSPIDIQFNNFLIQSLAAMAGTDSNLVSGELNGEVALENLSQNLVFAGDLTIKDLAYKVDTLGTLTMHVNNRTANTYNVEGDLTSPLNKLVIKGSYVSKAPEGSFNIDVDLEKLSLSTLESLSQNSINNASGTVSGNMKVTGTVSKPSIVGKVNFNEAALVVSMLNQYFLLADEQINFNQNGISLNNFTLKDSVGNTAVIDGVIRTSDYRSYAFQLDINADDFQVMNSTQADNQIFWGEVFIDADMKLRGDMGSPVVNGRVAINEDTKMTVVIPQSDPGVIEREGVVEFVRFDHPFNDTLWKQAYDSISKSSITGMDVLMDIKIDKKAEFNIIVDEGRGDFLRVKGQAEIAAGINPTGDISMTGSYEIEDGFYDLTFNLIKRKFQIEKGSSILWAGGPLDATVDITATYSLRTSPFDLVSNQIADASGTIQNTYKQRMPFDVDLSLNGEIMKPEIKFDVELDEEKNTGINSSVNSVVQAKLAQIRQEKSELNKQVFALLILNRFVSENPFATSTGLSAEDAARGSASKLLAEQLNKLSDNLIQGVDVDFGLESGSDYTTGEKRNRTNLNVGLSKRLLNDRLKVSVGNDFELEGPKTANQKTSNIAGNILIGYKLTPDGRYMAKVFRRNDYQSVVDGFVIETGASLGVSLDFDRFKDITLRSKTKQQREQEKYEEQLQRDKQKKKEQDNKDEEVGKKMNAKDEQDYSYLPKWLLKNI